MANGGDGSATRRPARLWPVLTLVFVGACIVLGVHLFRSQNPSPPTLTPMQAELIALADEVGDGPPTAEQLDRFLELAQTGDSADLRVFEYSEPAVARHPRAERDALLERFMARSNAIRSLARSAFARAAAARDAGRFDEAGALLDAVERLALANTKPPSEIVALGDLIGKALAKSVGEARAELDAARTSAAAPDAPGE